MYSNPIELTPPTIPTEHAITIYGTNQGATYIDRTHIFLVHDPVFMVHHDTTYRLYEYHFHIPSEHVTKKRYDAEVHYVFTTNVNHYDRMYDVCNGNGPSDHHVEVIGVLLQAGDEPLSPHTFQVHVPTRYFEYDGGLVRWMVGKYPLHYDLSSITSVAKPSRDLQSVHHRMILYAKEED